MLSIGLKIFFRRLEVSGLEHVPTDRGGLLVAWHPNGLVDPALVLSALPRDVVFGARHGLFQIPIVGRVLRALGTVPIYRRSDIAEQEVDQSRALNDTSLDVLADRIAAGSFSSLFPEGISHDAPFLLELKSGAARLYYRARMRTPAGRPPPALIPVGLHYDQKQVFRSSALVAFHPPLALPPDLDVTPRPDADAEEVRELARKLTAFLDPRLREVVLEAESWELHRALHRARKLIRAERASRAGAAPGTATMEERIAGLARVWTGYHERVRSSPTRVQDLRTRVERYDQRLRALGLEDHHLDEAPPLFRPWFWLLLVWQATSVFLFLPPLLIIGYVINLPTALVVTAGAELTGREGKDVASRKFVGGTLLFPLTWGLWGWLVAAAGDRFGSLAPWLPHSAVLAGVVTVLLGMAGAVVMVVYVGMARSTWRALRVRLTRGRRTRAFLRLKVERGRLYEELLELADGLELPGVVEADGRVSRAVP